MRLFNRDAHKRSIPYIRNHTVYWNIYCYFGTMLQGPFAGTQRPGLWRRVRAYKQKMHCRLHSYDSLVLIAS